MRHQIPPGGGAIPSVRRDDKMSPEHADPPGGWGGIWPKVVKKSMRKKRRQREAEICRDRTDEGD